MIQRRQFSHFLSFIVFLLSASVSSANLYWLEMKAETKEERSALAQQGFDIVAVENDRVIVLGNEASLNKAHATGLLLAQYLEKLSPFDFPSKDQNFHNYTELTAELQSIAQKNPEIASLSSIGRSVEGREIWMIRLTQAQEGAPGSVFMGGHHAREHVSVEIPLRLINYIVDQFHAKNPRIVALLSTYDIYIIPTVNPDGKEFDIATGKYQYWRKNRSRQGSSDYGVDLNRNYGYGWGGAGASASPKEDTYRGPGPFSEPETRAIQNFIESHSNIKTLLSYHTFSQLVLWPWGHVDEEVQNAVDLSVFKKAGQKMAQWTGYKPMKSGDLYLASGDTCDWAYGEHGIFAFTFELDPSNFFGGGFYPGQGILDSVFQKNIEPALYLIEISDNPYKILN